MGVPLNVGLRSNRGVGEKRPPRGGGSGAAEAMLRQGAAPPTNVNCPMLRPVAYSAQQ